MEHHKYFFFKQLGNVLYFHGVWIWINDVTSPWILFSREKFSSTAPWSFSFLPFFATTILFDWPFLRNSHHVSPIEKASNEACDYMSQDLSYFLQSHILGEYLHVNNWCKQATVTMGQVSGDANKQPFPTIGIYKGITLGYGWRERTRVIENKHLVKKYFAVI